MNARCEWDDILEDFRLPPACVNSATALKHIYIRYVSTPSHCRASCGTHCFLKLRVKTWSSETKGNFTNGSLDNTILIRTMTVGCHKIILHFVWRQFWLDFMCKQGLRDLGQISYVPLSIMVQGLPVHFQMCTVKCTVGKCKSLYSTNRGQQVYPYTTILGTHSNCRHIKWHHTTNHTYAQLLSWIPKRLLVYKF